MEDFYSQIKHENESENAPETKEKQADTQGVNKRLGDKETAHNAISMPSKMTNTVTFPNPIENNNAFFSRIEDAKAKFVDNLNPKDVERFQSALTDALVKNAEIEKEKADLISKNIQYHDELINTKRTLNEYEQKLNKWENKKRRREYHFSGVKPFMDFVGITNPMNLFCLYLIVFILFIPFVVDKIIKATLGALLSGANSDDRPKAMKGVLWTAFTLTVVFLLGIGILLILEWLNITDFIK